MYSLNLRKVKSPYNDITKGSVLSQEEVDNNFIKLKGDSIFSSSTDNGVVSLMKLNGETIEFTGGTTNFNTITKAELDNLISISGLTEGTFYKILGVNIDLYGGTDIILQATSNTTLSIYGNGIFYNPKYDSIKIWDNKTKILINNQIGDFQPNENITADNGATGTIIGLPGTESLILIQISGDWKTVANITGDTSLTTADMTSFENQYTYAIGAKVIWGGKVWRNLNGNLGSKVNNMNLDSEWELIPFNESDYIKVSDLIGYDITNDHIFYRKDKMNEITIVYDLFLYKFFVNSIQKFPWGNSNVFNTKIDNGFIDNLINFNGGYISNLNIELIGAFNFDYIGRNANIENLTIKSLSYFDGLILGDGNSIQNIYLDESTSMVDIVVANKDDFKANGGVYNIKLNQGINVDFFENNVYIYNLILYPNALLTNIELASAGNYQTETSLNNIILYNDAKLYNINLEKGAAFNYCTFGSNSKISEIDLGIFCAMANITTGTDCTIANIKLDGASGQLQGSLSSYLGKITFYNSVVFVSIHLGLASDMTNIVGADGVTIQDIITNNNTYIGNLRIALGGSLVGLTLGVFSDINHLYIGSKSTVNNICLKQQSIFEWNDIGDDSVIGNLTMGNNSIFTHNILENNSGLKNLTMGDNSQFYETTISSLSQIRDITIGDSCIVGVATFSTNIDGKIISKEINNFPAVLDITGLSTIPLSPISYAGEITLTSSNSSETVNLINLSQRLYPVTLKPASGLTLNITGTPAASIGFITQVLSPVATITLNGDTHDQATIITNNSYTRVIDYKNYL